MRRERRAQDHAALQVVFCAVAHQHPHVVPKRVECHQRVVLAASHARHVRHVKCCDRSQRRERLDSQPKLQLRAATLRAWLLLLELLQRVERCGVRALNACLFRDEIVLGKIQHAQTELVPRGRNASGLHHLGERGHQQLLRCEQVVGQNRLRGRVRVAARLNARTEHQLLCIFVLEKLGHITERPTFDFVQDAVDNVQECRERHLHRVLHEDRNVHRHFDARFQVSLAERTSVPAALVIAGQAA